MDKTSIARFLGLIAALVAYFGFEIGEQLQNAFVDVVFGGYIIYTAWKNNYITKKGKEQKELLDKNNLS